ncbi:uncharacterized protein OGAPODRAFT_15180 [Ogataea polymorpha]|uniref:uncharacterized protein n=1 Tax=Ogataea polymorpha TaxID=460523 RepID=UPI0007F49747|nr:uncharacterized protein OGAPODRAFT_15180 [Ogataea polymorpha]KAG7934621.1 hypothetical protein KL934_002547 [Ogataea polymorpha]OBA18389.1 hypothetical protein OGAPODRAFT_15180 [Ogataea polymorpha]
MWWLVASFLHDLDCLNLRATSKYLNVTFSANPLWKPRVLRKWYRFCESPNAETTRFWFNKYVEHSQYDRWLRGLIADLISGTEKTKSEIWEDVSYVFRNPQLFVPELLRMMKHFDSSFLRNGKYHKEDFVRQMDRRLHDLSTVYYASQLLEAIRLCKILNFGYRTICKSQYPQCLEDMFCEFAYVDPYVYDFYPYRKQVLGRVLREYNGLHLDSGLSNTNKVKLLASILQKALRLQSLPHSLTGDYYSQLTLEDCCLFRIYGGDAVGKTELIHSIMEKLCHELGIPARLNNLNLVVDDSTTRSGTSHFIIESYKTTQINIPDIRNMPRPSLMLNQYVSHVDPPKLIKNIAASFFCQYPMERRDRSDYMHPKVLDDQLFVERPDNRLQGQIIGFYGTDKDTINILHKFWTMLMQLETQNLEADLESTFLSLVQSSRLAFLGIGVACLTSTMEGIQSIHSKLKNAFMNGIISFNVNEVKRDDQLPFPKGSYSQFEDGQMVVDRRGEPMIIIGFKEYHKQLYCQCFTNTGQTVIVHEKNLGISNSKVDASQFALFDNLGLYFRDFDFRSGKFIRY